MVVVCPAPWERVSLLAEPLNLGTSVASVLAGAVLLAPSRFVCCGVDPRASEPVHVPTLQPHAPAAQFSHPAAPRTTGAAPCYWLRRG